MLLSADVSGFLTLRGWCVWWEGTRLGMCSHGVPFLQAAQRWLWTSSPGRLSHLLRFYEQTSLSVAFDFVFTCSLTPDLISYQILTVIPHQSFSNLSFFFPFHSRYQSGFNDLLFSLQKLPPNLNFTAFTLFYLVPCYQMNNSKVSFVSQTSFSAQTYPIFFIIFQIK